MKRILAACAVALAASAAGPTTWELTQYGDFIKGKLTNISLTRDGTLEPGPAVKTVVTIEDTSLWSLAVGPDGAAYLGTGPKGRIYKRPAGAATAELLATLPEAHIFALATGADGALFAASSPGGNVYRIVGKEAKLYGQTGAKFIWSLAVRGADVFAGGDDGRIFRLNGSTNEVYYESGQSNITSLAFSSDGALLAGSDPNGMLYRITAKGKAQLLYDAPFTEIRSIVPRPSGEVLFLAMGGAAAKRTQNVAQPASGGSTGVPQVTTTITVTEEAQAGIDLKPKPAAQTTPTTQASSTPVVTSSLDVPGLDRSAIYRLNADLTVDNLYTTKEETIFDIAEREGRIHFTTDKQGRIYRLDGDRMATLLAETGHGELGRMASSSTAWLITATTSPKLLELSGRAAGPYEYESPVHEAANIARWGALHLSATGAYTLESRSGNAARPDATWSDWQPLTGLNISSPAARYIQWRLKSTQDFKLRAATLNYLPRNQAPLVKSLTAVLAMVPSNAPKPQATTAASSTYTLTVTDTGEASSTTSAGTASQLATRPAGRQLILSWTAEDPDSDVLQYALHFRGEEETEWKLLKADLTEANYSIDADTLGDGRYLFRVTASDGLSNSLATTLSAVFQSVPVQLDQTPPQLEVTLTDQQLNIRCRDTASPIRRIEYAVNAGRWVVVDATDGIYDSLEEAATVGLTLAPGESVITVRAFDALMNVALRKIVVRR
jgi:hypothetical protein